MSDYKDRYRQKVKEAIAAKKKGVELTPPEEEEEPDVINLIDTLKASVARANKTSSTRRKRAKRKPHTARRKRA